MKMVVYWIESMAGEIGQKVESRVRERVGSRGAWSPRGKRIRTQPNKQVVEG